MRNASEILILQIEQAFYYLILIFFYHFDIFYNRLKHVKTSQFYFIFFIS